VRCLGPLEVYDEKRPLALGGRQQRSLLALLLLHANEAVPVERIIDELWPDAPPPSATKSVQALATLPRFGSIRDTVPPRWATQMLLNPDAIELTPHPALAPSGSRTLSTTPPCRASAEHSLCA
jgi:hypothetical protein